MQGCGDTGGIKLAAGMLLQIGKCRLERPCLLVGALAGQGIKHIGHRHDARRQRDRLPRQPQRIAGAVKALVMAGDDVGQHVGVMNAIETKLVDHQADHLPPLAGVDLHDLELFRGQLARLEQNGIRHRDLADVVQLGEEVDKLHLLIAQPASRGQRLGDQPGVGRHPVQMVGGLLIPIAAELPRRGQRAAKGLDGEKLHRNDGRERLGIGRQLAADRLLEVSRLHGIAKQKTKQLAVEQQRLGIAGGITRLQHLAAVLRRRATQGIEIAEHPGLLVLRQITQGGNIAQLHLILHQRRGPLGAVGKGLELIGMGIVNRDGHPTQLVKALPERGMYALHFFAK